MKSLIFVTIFAMLIILSFMVGWSLMMLKYANNNLLSLNNNDFSDKVFLAQLQRAE